MLVFCVLAALMLPYFVAVLCLRFAAGLLARTVHGVSNTSLKVLETRALGHAVGSHRNALAYRTACAVPLTGPFVPWIVRPLAWLCRIGSVVPPTLRATKASAAAIVAQRTAFIDRALQQYLASRTDAVAQVVCIGAGFDVRAYGDEMRQRVRDKRLVFVEVDTAERSALKQATLQAVSLATSA